MGVSSGRRVGLWMLFRDRVVMRWDRREGAVELDIEVEWERV